MVLSWEAPLSDSLSLECEVGENSKGQIYQAVDGTVLSWPVNTLENVWRPGNLAEQADRASRHRTFISQIERVTRSPTLDTVDRIAAAFGVTIGELVD